MAQQVAVFEKDADLLISEFSEQMIKEFDLNGSGLFWSQVVANSQNKINTWGIFGMRLFLKMVVYVLTHILAMLLTLVLMEVEYTVVLMKGE